MLYLFWLICQTKTTCKHSILSKLQPNPMVFNATGKSTLVALSTFQSSQKLTSQSVRLGHLCKEQALCASSLSCFTAWVSMCRGQRYVIDGQNGVRWAGWIRTEKGAVLAAVVFTKF